MSPASPLPCLGTILAVGLTLACAPPEKPGNVKVSVVAILASESDKDDVNRDLKCIAAEVRKLHPKLRVFQKGQISGQSLPVGAQETFPLVDNEKVTVVVEKAADKMDRIQLKVCPPAMGEITYDTACGKYLPIVTKYRTKDGQLLIIAIRVQPCSGGK